MRHLIDIDKVNELQRLLGKETRYEKLESLIIPVTRAMVAEAFNRRMMGRESVDEELRETLRNDESAEVEVARLSFSGIRSDKSAYSGWVIASPQNFMTTTHQGQVVMLNTNRGVYHYKCAERKALEVWKEWFRDANQWSLTTAKESVMDIFARVQLGEWVGQHIQGRIYVGEVAELLGVPNHESFGSNNPIWKILNDLCAEERLELHGAILAPYTARFLLPSEIRGLLAYMIEEPLGWPNGDAGDMALAMLEGAIESGTHYKNGKDLVGSHNFPHIAPRYLFQFGYAWMKTALERSREKPDDPNAVQHAFNADDFIKHLEELIADLRALPPSRPSE